MGFALFLCSPVSIAGNATLAWDPSPSSGVGGYRLSYGQISGQYTATIDVGNTTSFTASGLTDGTTYFFAVKTYNLSGSTESAYSNEVSIVIPVQEPITADFTASVTSGPASLVVNFTPVTTGTISSWNWQFPGSYTPTVSLSVPDVVTVTYPDPGTFSVSLTVQGPTGSNLMTKADLITVTSPPVSDPPPVQEPPPPGPGASLAGLVAAYGFDEDSGAIVFDASGQDNHGAIQEAVRNPNGHYGNALAFDGVNDWVTVPDSASLDLSTGLSLEAWVYPRSLTNGGKSLIVKETSGGAAYSLYANYTRYNSIGSSNFPFSSFYNGVYQVIAAPDQLPVNQWTHVASTYDGQNQRFYVNGVEVANRSENGLIDVSGGNLRIGGNSVWGEFFDGYIDEVRIYNRALTETEVNANLLTPVSVSNPERFILGNMNEEPTVDYQRQGRAQAFRAIAETSGEVTSVQIYLASGTSATKIAAGIYRDNGGHPGILISQSQLSDLKLDQWNSVPVPEATVIGEKFYWIAVLGINGQIAFLDQAGSGTGIMERSSSRNLTRLASSWSGDIRGVRTNTSMSAYGTGF
ncbi:MAG: LamG-like jellyroll fold domain-containing protein [Gammaproteobacteria bacterium]